MGMRDFIHRAKIGCCAKNIKDIFWIIIIFLGRSVKSRTYPEEFLNFAF